MVQWTISSDERREPKRAAMREKPRRRGGAFPFRNLYSIPVRLGADLG
jgi:hypothetical protein